ncbi:hypothetical protein ACFXPR_31645 [Nocardia tengchongensis]|uniref:hypothetical protein n=1 Tax=Nocardia tengchongensis TaxID=2055889 RepID=UPI0036C809E6
MAILYYWALQKMMAKANIRLTVDQVDALIGEWLAGQRRVWPSRSHDAATGWSFLHLWMRTQTGQPIQVTARVMTPAITVTDVRPLTVAQIAEFEQWEETHND